MGKGYLLMLKEFTRGKLTPWFIGVYNGF